jgi:hypothetical protein
MAVVLSLEVYGLTDVRPFDDARQLVLGRG